MKRFLLFGLLLLGASQMPAQAQRRGSFADDIYYNSSDARKDAQKHQEAYSQQQENNNTTGESDNAYNSSDGSEAPVRDNYNVDDDDYGYAARINRFSYPSYRIGYYSPWYDPFYDPWYNPWYAPYWRGPGVSIVIGSTWGYGGGWGGYGFGSPWGGWGGYGFGPWGGYGWGGYGYGGGYWNGYNNGFYDGYYSGGGYGYGRGSVRNVTYGPRTSMNMPRNNGLRGAGGMRSTNTTTTNGPRNGQLRMDNSNTTGRNPNRFEGRTDRVMSPDNGNNPNMRSNSGRSYGEPAMQDRAGRVRIFGGNAGRSERMNNGGIINQGVQQQQSAPIRSTEPSSRPQRSVSPSYERSSAPSRSYSAPSRSSGGGSAPTRSFGGGRR